jgi:hypothetical protein
MVHDIGGVLEFFGGISIVVIVSLPSVPLFVQFPFDLLAGVPLLFGLLGEISLRGCLKSWRLS